jgi:hypothetical protein
MLGSGGLFRQQNMEKRRIMSVREWAELCSKTDFKAPGLNDVGLHARSNVQVTKPRRGKKRTTTQATETAEPEVATPIKDEAAEVDMDDLDEECAEEPPTDPQPNSADIAETENDTSSFDPTADNKVEKSAGSGSTPAGLEVDAKKTKPRRAAQTRESREANLAERAARDVEFLKTFNPHTDWLPNDTSGADYTFEFCQKLERQYWRNCGLGRPAWYGADTQGWVISCLLPHPANHAWQALCTQTRPHVGTLRIFRQPCPGCYRLPQQEFQASTPPTFTLACGELLSLGMWRIWIYLA